MLDHFMYMYNDKKFMPRLFTVLFLVKKNKPKILCSIHPKTLVSVIHITVKFYKVLCD